jgi:hypothetical protein
MQRLPFNPEPLLALFMTKENAGSFAGDLDERFQRICQPSSRCLNPFSFLDDDARHRVNLEPLGVLHVLDPRPGNQNVGTNWRDCNSAVKPLAGGYGVSLCDGKHANDLEYEVATFVRSVSTVEEFLLSGVQLQPTVCITIAFVSNPCLAVRILTGSCVYDGSRHGDAFLLND